MRVLRSSKLAAVVALSVCALLVGSCGGSDPTPEPEPTAPECTAREACDAGEICTSDGRCSGCQSSGECLLKESCSAETRLCALREGWGTECALNEDCSAGRYCHQGNCAARNDVTLCPAGTNAECPPGQRCQTQNLVCEEDLGCAQNGDCGANEVCNVGLRACVPRCTAETATQVCAEGERCDAAGRCAQCETNAECAAGLVCDAAGKCTAGASCYSDRDCRVPQICFVPTGTCVERLPPCVSDENCASDQRCDLPNGRCIPRSCVGDRLEPNNTLETAASLTASRYDELTLCPGDVDWYAVSLKRGDELGINLDADPFAEFTFSTTIHDATGRTLASGRLLASFVASATATYYVRVSTTDPYQPYDILVLLSQGTPCDDDSFEPNDTPATATALNASTSLSGVVCPQDADHLAINVPIGRGATVSLDAYDASRGLLRLCVFDGANELGCSQDTPPSVVVGAAAAGGKTLVARVTGVSNLSTNRYTFRVVYP